METSSIEESQRKAARIAGLSCLIAMAIVIITNFVIDDRLIVAGNAAETSRNILANQSLFRAGTVCYLMYCASIVVLLSALYVILKPINRNVALIAAFWRLAYSLVWISIALNRFTALRILNGADYLQAFDTQRQQALARLYLSGFDAYYVGLLFFALASTLCSYLWLKSKYVPRTLAAFGLISSAWCVVCTFAFLILPNFKNAVNLWWFDSPLGIFEIVISFWLIFKGLQPSDLRVPNDI
jgi:hypothetical protein